MMENGWNAPIFLLHISFKIKFTFAEVYKICSTQLIFSWAVSSLMNGSDHSECCICVNFQRIPFCTLLYSLKNIYIRIY